MFDASFFELLIIAVVALLVVGPERLPGLAIKAGQYISRLRRLWQNTKYDIEREMHNAEIMRVTENVKEDLDDIVKHIDDEMHQLPEPSKPANKKKSKAKRSKVEKNVD